MPFTFSHPAIILPLKKKFGAIFSLTGLIIGSLVPDFEYFMRMKVESIYSHSFWGLFWFDLPLAVLLTFVYHNIVRDPFITNLPTILNERLNDFKNFNWPAYFKQNWYIVIISILVGAASHLLWDAFTHPTGYFVNKIPFLQKQITVMTIPIRLFRFLQHLSTLFGGIVVLWAIFSLKNKPVSQSNRKAVYWLPVMVITFIIIVARFLKGLSFHLYGDIVVTVISAFLTSIIITPLIYRLIFKKSPGLKRI